MNKSNQLSNMPNSAERREPVTATIMIILLFTAFGLLVWALSSCSTTQPVYKYGNGWSKMPAKSAMTGIAYNK